MDPGLIKLLEDDEEDESGPPVSGAAVDAYTERLKGVLGDGATVAAAAAYGLARAGNGSLKPIPSPASLQAPTASSVPPATAGAPKTMSAPIQITQEQWSKMTPQQQQVFRQQHIYRQQLVQRQQQVAQQRAGAQQQQAQQVQQAQQAQQQQQQPQQAGAAAPAAAAAAAGAQAQRRPNTISQGISFGALMPLLQPHLPPDKSERLSALYQRFKQNEITREDFVRGARVIVGDQVLVQTIRQMHQKQGPPQAGAQQAAGQQPAVSQQSATSSQVSGPQQPGQQPVQQAAIPPGPSAQAPETQGSQSGTTPNVSSAVPVHTQPLHQQQQGQSQVGSNSAGPQQTKVEAQPQGSSQSSQGKPPGLLPGAVPVRPNVPGNLKPAEQNVQGGEATSQTVSSAPPTLQQVKNEVEKAAVPAQAVRPLQVPASSPFGGFQARPPTLSANPTVGGNQVHLGVSAQVPRVSTPVQFNALSQAGQVRPAFSQAMSDSSQPSDPKPVPVLTKYAKAKLRKEQKKAEEEERMRKLQEEDRLRRQQAGGATVGNSQPLTPTQVAQSLSMPVAVPQPHPKLLESKNSQAVHAIPGVKQEPQADQHAGQRGLVAPLQTSQVGIRAPGQLDAPETSGSRATPIAAKEANLGSGGGDKSQMNTPQAASPMARYPGVPGVGNATNPIAVGAVGSGSSTPQPGGGVRQGPPYALASSTPPGLKDASGIGNSGPVGSGVQAMSGGVKTPVKKVGVAVGQKKPGETIPAAAQPANKKQKTQGPDADQSIDVLNDVTAVSGVNLREEEEQLLAGPKEESRTTEAMRKFVQEEEERLFLEKGPLRSKVQAIAAKFGLSLSNDMERCLSLACEERLRSMLYKMIKYSKQRCDIEKDLHNTITGFDPRRQILLMKRRTKEAMEKKVAAENERLRKLNEKKDKGALADGDNEDLRLKAQKAQQEEDDKMRAKAANVAARAAVGATDMLSKWQMMAAQGLAKRQGGDPATDSARAGSADEASGSREQEGGLENGEAGKATGIGRTDSGGDGAPASATAASRPPGSGSGTGRGGNNAVRRIGAGHGGKQPRSMTMKDVIALLEREPVMSKSAFLYRLYERRDRKGESSRRL